MQGSVEPQVAQRDPQMPPLEHAGEMQYLPLKDLFEQLHASGRGLTNQEAQQRLSEAGPNEPVGVQHTTALIHSPPGAG